MIGGGGGQDFAVVLSEYWLEGIDEGLYELSVEEILAADLPKAQSVQENLAAELGPEYDTTVICNVW